MSPLPKKNVVVIGSGGREHAFCWKLAQSETVQKIYALPGSPGMDLIEKVECVTKCNLNDFKEIVKWCQTTNIDMVVVGPEAPLVAGLGDELKAGNILCFGPDKKGAQIEADKNWSKDFMMRHNIPTAKYKSFTDAAEAKKFIRGAPFDATVIKASGLAAGKGVIVAANIEEACAAADEILGNKIFGAAGDVAVVEEKLTGEEVSVLAFVDKNTVRVMLPAQDHKRLQNGDIGPNTGGMGAYCPYPNITSEEMEMIRRDVLQNAVDGLRKEGIEYKGVLYAGMMLTPNGPKTLEFNCRFGDPETQVILPLLETDLYEIMEACCKNSLASIDIKFNTGLSAVGVVMASKGYPETATKGCIITGLRTKNTDTEIVFHSGVGKDNNGNIVTNGGRVLTNVAIGSNLKSVAAVATRACKDITFDGAQYRTDIAFKAYKQQEFSYKKSGVDIDAGNNLVLRIKTLARGTDRPGVVGGIGGFGGLFRLNEVKYLNNKNELVSYEDPVLVQGTDGVGTKLKVAREMGVWDTIGIDLVAMCVNDVLCSGAEPLAFLDYIACGKLDVPTAALIVKGISEACRDSKCALLGGETAEMPTMYSIGKYDLAGYCVGVVEHDNILPKMDTILANDLVIGLPSSGVHSNGYSLINKIMKDNQIKFSDTAPFSKHKLSYGLEFLTPTKLYVRELLPLLQKKQVKALAHITGGGLLENIPRILPEHLAVDIDASLINIPAVFGWIRAHGKISDAEMLRTFNCGIGMIVIVPAGDTNWKSLIQYGAKQIGTLTTRSNGAPQVIVRNFTANIDKVAKVYDSDVKNKVPITYKTSGVDIVAGDNLVSRIKPFAKSTTRPGVLGGLGGFSGLFRVKDLFYTKSGIRKNYDDPILVLGTDGVGTKLKIAQEINKNDSIGIDLVAMCVNDILCNGAEPLTFLDYYACGKLDVGVAADVVSGICEGCRQSGSALLGGETAEMPGMYEENVYDLAGFSMGIVENSCILPKINDVHIGDVIISLPSNGLHSNGFSLVHKVMEHVNANLNNVAPFSACNRTFAEELLNPTRIYVSAVLPVLRAGLVKAVAHITGGGLTENIARVLPKNMGAEIEAKTFNIPPIFGWLAQVGNINDNEMLRTYNCGIGMILIVSQDICRTVMKMLHEHGPSVVGKIIPRKPVENQVIINDFSLCIQRVQRILTIPKKRVGVLISGTGSNLQALIDATRNTNLGLGAEIVYVISNKPNVLGLERAANANIKSKVMSHKDFTTREEFDEAISQELVKHKIDIVCLAGFMRILSVSFVRRWKGRLINIHPSLLPKYPGTHVQQQALDANESESGCTVHFVDEGVDTGAIIVQEVVEILPGDTVDTLTQRIHKSEHIAFPKALRLIATEAVTINDLDETYCQ